VKAAVMGTEDLDIALNGCAEYRPVIAIGKRQLHWGAYIDEFGDVDQEGEIARNILVGESVQRPDTGIMQDLFQFVKDGLRENELMPTSQNSQQN
jgi:hypothetical protein